MKYTVIWQPEAQGQLAELWESAGDRALVTAAADEMDRLLALEPIQASESREGSTRIIFVSPVGAYFRVFETERTVRVARVWRY